MAFFYVWFMNVHEKDVDLENLQILRCIVYCSSLVSFVIINQWTRVIKGLVSYFQSNGITTLKKNVNGKHGLLAKKFEEEVDNNTKFLMERQFAKKMPKMIGSAIFNYLGFVDSLRKIMCIKNNSYKIWLFFLSKIRYPFSLSRIFHWKYDNAKLWASCYVPFQKKTFFQ